MRINNKELVVLCEHASFSIPDEFKNLGLSKDVVESYLAYDPGVKEASGYIAEHFGCKCFCGNVSRLLIDLNRCSEDTDMVPEKRFGFKIDANINISAEEKNKRIVFYNEYHNEVAAYIKTLVGQGKDPVVLSIHSFPVKDMSSLLGEEINTECGLLFNKDERLADAVYSSIKQTNVNVEKNYPYDLRKYKSGGVIQHGEKNGHPYLGVEFPNTLLVQKDQRERLVGELIKGLEVFLGSE